MTQASVTSLDSNGGGIQSSSENDDRDVTQRRRDLESKSTPRQSRLSSAIATFSPNWYAICMNTGLLGILLHQFPYRFHGFAVLSTVFWIADIALFVLFTLIQIVRHLLYPRAAYRQTCASMDEMCFWGCMPIALVTIVAQIGINGSNTSSWTASTRHGLTVFAIVLWWITVAIMLSVAFVVYYAIAKRRMSAQTPIPPGIFLPAVGTTTVALVGGTICNYSYQMSSRLAVPVIIISYILNGFGWWLALLVFPVFLSDMWSKGLPIPFKLPSVMMLVGPAGQAGAALNALGTAATIHFGNYNKGVFLTSFSATALQGGSMMFALLLLGFDIFWAIFVFYALIETGFKRLLKPGMPWWSTIFPLGTLNTTFLVLGVELDSPTFRVLATILYLILLIDYFICWAMTIYLVYMGDLLDGRPREKKD